MKHLTTFLITFLLFTQNLWAAPRFAQQDVAMADKLREDGKIWVVVGVISIVFVGIIVYLISLDRKISKIEKNQDL